MLTLSLERLLCDSYSLNMKEASAIQQQQSPSQKQHTAVNNVTYDAVVKQHHDTAAQQQQLSRIVMYEMF
jgi:hypothetical protein